MRWPPSLLLTLGLLLGCGHGLPAPTDAGEDTPADVPPGPDAGPARAGRPALPHPSLLVRTEDRAVILERVEREPYATALARLRDRAAADLRDPDPDEWDHEAYGHNGCIAQANAVLAWLFDDVEAAAKAKRILLDLRPDVETNTLFDLNIRMPAPLICHTNTWDLLQATGTLSEAEAARVGEVLTAITEHFYGEFVLDGVMRNFALGVSQNNHPIRTASAVGYVALAFPEHPRSDRWLDWAVSELDYLYGPTGHYVQPDGGISEGPFYFGFGARAALAFLHALENAGLDEHVYLRDCINRVDRDPWLDHGCVEDEPFVFENLLDRPAFHAIFDWNINLRLPSGQRPPFEDSRLHTLGLSPLLTGHGGAAHLMWDWRQNTVDPMHVPSAVLEPHYLTMVDDSVGSAEPPWRNRFLPAAGNAVFRSGWQPDDHFLLLVAENGSVRKNVHDHVDGTSFQMAAYGDYLLSDTGYYKPNPLDNALTAHAPSHSVLLIDGRGAPDKGLLTNWGDADAFLENPLDGDALAWSEARQTYEQTEIVRGVAFVRRRYFVVADRLVTEASAAREHRFRVHANAGYDAGHTFEVGDASLTVARETGGVVVRTASTAGPVRWETPAYEPLVAPHVHEYNSDDGEDHGVADAVVTALAPGFLSVLAPFRVGVAAGEDAPLEVTPLDAGADAAAWLVRGQAFEDLLWLRGPAASGSLTLPDDRVVATDGAFAVISLAGEMGLLARGTSATLAGVAVVTTDRPVAIVEP